MADKVRALIESELGRLPAKLKPFIQKIGKDDPDNKIFMTLSFMGYAYGEAFTQLAESALDDWPKKNYIVQPMLYLARHSMELNLKWVISTYQEYLNDYTEKTDHHSLTKLWNTLTTLLLTAGAPTDIDYSKHCLKLLITLAGTTPMASDFGIPTTKMEGHSNWPRSIWRGW